jgi:hypothetical protein
MKDKGSKLLFLLLKRSSTRDRIVVPWCIFTAYGILFFNSAWFLLFSVPIGLIFAYFMFYLDIFMRNILLEETEWDVFLKENALTIHLASLISALILPIHSLCVRALAVIGSQVVSLIIWSDILECPKPDPRVEEFYMRHFMHLDKEVLKYFSSADFALAMQKRRQKRFKKILFEKLDLKDAPSYQEVLKFERHLKG